MLQRIDPNKLNGKQKEIYNFQKSASLLADYGFNCIKLSDDWQGADFLAHHFDGKTTLRVQLKARLTIDRKYLGQDLWMNFPSAGAWYLVPHNKLVEVIGETTNWLNTSSWQEHGSYSSANPSPRLLQQLRPFAVVATDVPTSLSAKPLANAPEKPKKPSGREVKESRANEDNLGPWRRPNVSQAVKALVAAGYTCFPATNEGRGVDLVIRRDKGGPTTRVRCPGRVAIRRDLIGKDINVAFPDQDGIWYLVPHDTLVGEVERYTPWLNSDSWQLHGWYSSANPSRELRAAIRQFALSHSRPETGQEIPTFEQERKGRLAERDGRLAEQEARLAAQARVRELEAELAQRKEEG